MVTTTKVIFNKVLATLIPVICFNFVTYSQVDGILKEPYYLEGRSITLNPTPNLDFKYSTNKTTEQRNLEILSKDKKSVIRFFDVANRIEIYTYTLPSKEEDMEAFRSSVLYSKLNDNVRGKVVHYVRADNDAESIIAVYILTPTGQVVFFEASPVYYAVPIDKLTDLLAEFLNGLEFHSYTPMPQENISYTRLGAAPLDSRELYASDEENLLVAYKSEQGDVFADIFNLATHQKTNTITFKDAGIDAVVGCALRGDEIALLLVPHFTMEEAYAPNATQALECRIYSFDGSLKTQFNVAEEKLITKVGDYGYYGLQPEIILTEDKITVFFALYQKMSDGIQHQMDGYTIFDKEGTMLEQQKNNASHSFDQYATFFDGYFYFYSACDGFPRAINCTQESSGYRRETEFFPFPGEDGHNYIYDTHIDAVFHHENGYLMIINTELYDGNVKSHSYSMPNDGVGVSRNNLFIITVDENSSATIIPLLHDNQKDMHVTASTELPNGNYLLNVLTLSKNPNSEKNYDDVVLFNGAAMHTYRTKNIDQLYTYEEYFVIISKTGEIINPRIDYKNGQNYFWREYKYMQNPEELRGIFYLDGEKLTFAHQLLGTNYMEFISFEISQFTE